MANYLQENGYNHDQVKVVRMHDIINPNINKSLEELTDRVNELNLLSIVLRKETYCEYGIEIHEYICVDNHDLLALRILQHVKVVHAVVLY